jgi:hypothetical protein
MVILEYIVANELYCKWSEKTKQNRKILFCFWFCFVFAFDFVLLLILFCFCFCFSDHLYKFCYYPANAIFTSVSAVNICIVFIIIIAVVITIAIIDNIPLFYYLILRNTKQKISLNCKWSNLPVMPSQYYCILLL